MTLSFLKIKKWLLGGLGVLILSITWLFPIKPKGAEFLGFSEPLWLYEEEEALTDDSLLQTEVLPDNNK